MKMYKVQKKNALFLVFLRRPCQKSVIFTVNHWPSELNRRQTLPLRDRFYSSVLVIWLN